MSNRSKVHHFLPRVMQKSFCFRDNEIWYAEKKTDGKFKSPELTSTEKAFQISNYYSIRINGELSDVAETKYFGRVDNLLGSLIPDVLSSFDRGEVPVFSEDYLSLLHDLVYVMIKRTPEFPLNYKDLNAGKEIVREAIDKLGTCYEDQVLREKLVLELEDPVALSSYGRDVRVGAIVRPSERVKRAMSNLVVRRAVSRSKHSFILSSKIAYRIGNGGSNGLSNPNMEIWMPISPKISMVLLRDPTNSIPSIYVDTPTHIRKVNEFAAQNSGRIASKSQKLIESLTGVKSRFGTLPMSERGKIV